MNTNGGKLRISTIAAALMIGAVLTMLSTPAAAQDDPVLTRLGDPLPGLDRPDDFGSAVAISEDGRTVVVGYTRVYRWDGEAWTRLGSDLNAEGSQIALSADGGTIIVGDPSDCRDLDPCDGEEKGNARILRFDEGTGDWKQLGEDIDGGQVDEQFGSAVAISADGNTIAVGAPGFDQPDADAGYVAVYTFTDGGWVPVGDPIRGTQDSQYLGHRVDLTSDGVVVLVASRQNQIEAFFGSGGRWIGWDGFFDGMTRDAAISGNGAVIAVGVDSTAAIPGQVRTYTRTGEGFALIEVVTVDHRIETVDLSEDGRTMLVGTSDAENAILYQLDEVAGDGEADIDPNSTWEVVAQIDTNIEPGLSGKSVALSGSGDTIVVGPGSPGSSSVYVLGSNPDGGGGGGGGGNSGCEGLVREAEDGTTYGTMVVVQDPSASGGAYVTSPEGSGYSKDLTDRTTFCFEIDQTTTFRIDAMAQGVSWTSDSFFVTLSGDPKGGDPETAYLWDVRNSDKGFVLDSVSDRGSGQDPLLLTLEPGTHYLSFHVREDGTHLDRFELVPVEVSSCAVTEKVVQAEDGALAGAFAMLDNPDAEGGQHIEVPIGDASATGKPLGQSTATYCVRVQDGTWDKLQILAQVQGTSWTSDSFFVTVEGPSGSSTHLWDVALDDKGFVADYVSDRDGGGKPVTFDLAPGDYTITFELREPGTRLDSFAVVPAKK